MTLSNTTCCGVDEMEGLEYDPLQNMLQYCEERFIMGETQAFVLITDAVKNGNGRRLVNFILNNKLGSVISTESKKNPNSGNYIRAWLWSPNIKEVKSWWKNNKPKSLLEYW